MHLLCILHNFKERNRSKKSAQIHLPCLFVVSYGRTWMPQILWFHENSNTLNMFFLDRCSAQQSHLKLSKWVTFNWCYAFYLILKKGNDQKNRPKSTSPAFLLFHMANVEAKNLVISWNFQLFKHVFLSRCSTLQSRLKLSKWVIFNDFQTFSTFSEFQKRAEKIGRKPCPLYEGSKWKERWDHLVPHMIEQTARGEVFPRIWADFLNFMQFFSSF